MADVTIQEMANEAKEQFINGNYKVAEPLLQQLILQSGQNPELHQMLATIYYDRGQFNKAIKTFKRALEIDPTYTDASVGLSIILNDLGRYEEGKKVFIEAQALLDRKKGKIDPYIEEKLATKHQELADLYFQYQRYTDALEQFYKAQKLSNRKVDFAFRIAECFVQMGDSPKAIKELRQIIKDYPQNIQARLKLGSIFYNQNNLADATEMWESILLREPHHAEAKRLLRMAQTASITALEL